MLVDDGVPSRGHYNNIFRDTYKVCGIACGKHKIYKHMCCLDYSSGFTTKGGKKYSGTTKHQKVNVQVKPRKA